MKPAFTWSELELGRKLEWGEPVGLRASKDQTDGMPKKGAGIGPGRDIAATLTGACDQPPAAVW